MTEPRRPVLVVLRHHGLGDLLTAQPALRALRRGFPEHEMVVTCPSWLVALARRLGVADRWITERNEDAEAIVPTDHQGIDGALLARVVEHVGSADFLVALRTPGPELPPVVEALAPRRVVGYRYSALPATASFPELDFTDPILVRWQRLLDPLGLESREADLHAELREPVTAHGATLVHVGSGSPARQWPLDRWVEVARHLEGRGHRVVLTGSRGEAPWVARARRAAELPPERDWSGDDDILELARRVAGARLVLSVNTGVSHLATTFRRPALTLFGPISPAWWGPPAACASWHRTLWAGRLGEPYADTVDPGLLAISVEQVLDAIDAMERDGVVGSPTARVS